LAIVLFSSNINVEQTFVNNYYLNVNQLAFLVRYHRLYNVE